MELKLTLSLALFTLTILLTKEQTTPPLTNTDFLKKYKLLQGCMEIEQVAINVGPGRGQEHYYTKGI